MVTVGEVLVEALRHVRNGIERRKDSIDQVVTLRAKAQPTFKTVDEGLERLHGAPIATLRGESA